MNNQNTNKSDAPPAKSWAQWFNRTAQFYDNPQMKMAYYEDGQTGKTVPDKIMEATYTDIWTKLQADTNSTVLDVGCGVGLFEQLYQDQVKRIIGTDIAPQMVRDALSIIPQGTFLASEANRLPFQSNSFDRILCYGVFLYLPDKPTAAKVIDEFVRTLQVTGAILIGDILEPFAQKSSGGSNNNFKPWWPTNLNHNLTKLIFEPQFFVDYAKERGIQCKILQQDIPGRTLPSPRYDVLIKKRL